MQDHVERETTEIQITQKWEEKGETLTLHPFYYSPLLILRPYWKLTWHHLYYMFTYIYSLLIEKDIYDSQNVSVKLSYV